MRSGGLLAATAAALLITAPAAWYFGSPWWTLWRMREAARARDLETLAAYVDRAAIRAQAERDLKGFLGSLLADGGNGGDFMDRARRKLGSRPGSRLTDLQPWLSSMSIRIAGLGGGAGDPGYRPYVLRRGFDTFEVREEKAGSKRGPALTFRRHGLDWKLSGVRVGQQ